MKGIFGIITLVLVIFAMGAFFGEEIDVRPNKDSISRKFQVIKITPEIHSISIVKNNENGERYGSLRRVLDSKAGEKITFITNGGIFKPDFHPEGLYIHDSTEITPVNLREGEGNFYMRPGGVLGVNSNGFFVETLQQFEGNKNTTYEATQSGPMLVSENKINPLFKERSNSKRLRSGVGVTGTGEAVFVISRKEVTFYEFALFFQNQGAENALYLDGVISKMYIPGTRPFDVGGDFSTIIVATKNEK